jgi:hypothetical protein
MRAWPAPILAPNAGPLPVRVLRVVARAASLASLCLLVMFATSGGAWPRASEWLLIAFFPVGVAAGMVVAWHREVLGGAIAAASLLAFHLLLLGVGDRPWPGPWFIAFALPGLALLACGLASARPARP